MPPPKEADSNDFILVNVCHLHRVRASRLFEALGLYQGQPPVLFKLWEEEGLTQTALAARMNITPATLTRMLQRMEKSGFIRREPDPADQRVLRVYVTEAGHAAKEEIEKIWKTMETETFANLSPEELALLNKMLRQMRENLRQATGEEPWKS